MRAPHSPRYRLWAAPVLWILLSTPSFAQRMPPPSQVEDWVSPHNLNRLKLDLQVLPEYRAKKLPDGGEEPPKAPWPFCLYVQGMDTSTSERIDGRLLSDVRVVLATRAVKLVRVTPERALDLPYLARVSNLRDPCLVFVDRDFHVVRTLVEPKELEERGVLPVLEKAVDAEYPISLKTFVAGHVDLMEKEEALWKDEEKVSELQRKAAQSGPPKSAEYEEEAEELEAEVERKREALVREEEALLARLTVTQPEAEPLPATFGAGREERELTPEELEAIAAYREFARDDNPQVRAAAVEDLGAIDSGAMVELVLTAAKDTDDRVVLAAGRALGRMRSDESLEVMAAAVSSGDARSRRAAILGFAHVERRYPPVVPQLIPLVGHRDPDIRHAVLQALAHQEHPFAEQALIGALDDSVPALRVLAAQALAALRSQQAVPGLLAKLQDADWSMQKAAAEALGKIRSRDSIEPILERMEQGEGLLVEVLHKALVRITGEDFGLEAQYWRRWWERYRDPFELPGDAEVEEKLKRVAEAMARYTGHRRTYHTITTLSQRLLFVIDVSSSMAGKVQIQPGATDEDIARFESRVKMDIAKAELIDLLANLESNVRFNIITFAGDVEPWKDGLVGAGSRTAAIKFVAKLEPKEPSRGHRRGVTGGGEEQKTNTYGALMAAFGLAGDDTDWKSRVDADTVFFLTDGNPTTGEIVDTTKLIHHFTELNRTRGLVIHLITFDDHTARELGQLATFNGGQVVVRKIGG